MKNCFLYETLNPVTEMKVREENGFMTLSGTFGVCGKRNRNHRVYEKANYGKCVAEMQKLIKETGAIPGELEHPQTMNITTENISHKITDIQIDENGVVTGTIQLLNTPKGKIAQAIVEGGLPLYVSSRAMGQVDKNGNVTLENIATYDLVGTPGFAEARMHLNESQLFESLDDNLCIITNKNEEVDENKENNEEDMNKEVLEKIEALEGRIKELEDINEDLSTRLEEAEDKQIDIKKLAEGIQTWIVNEYSPVVEGWIKDEVVGHVINENKKVFVKEIAPKIQQWVVEDFAPELQNWIMEQYSPEIEKWCLESFAPGIQNWMVEHFSPEIQNWVEEGFGAQVKDMIAEGLTENKDSKLKSIAETLTLLEGLDVTKPSFSKPINENGSEDTPLYIQMMPESVQPKYNMASSEVKESIARRAKLYDFTNEGAIERFWENINFEEIKPAKSIYEGLDQIEDLRERQIRASFRRHRM